MEVKQVIKEVLADYNYNRANGMPEEQSLEVLRAMLFDLIEYEKQLAYDLGQSSGQYGILWDLQTKGLEYVRATYLKDGTPGHTSLKSPVPDPLPRSASESAAT